MINIALWETRRISLTFPQVRERVTKREAKGRNHDMCGGKWKEHLEGQDVELLLSTRLESGCVHSVSIGQEVTIQYVDPTNTKAIRKSQRGMIGGFPNLRLKKILTSGVCKLQPKGHIRPHPLVDVLSIIAFWLPHCAE